MRPLDIQVIGRELAIKWSDGEETFIGLEQLRRACPCALCQGESDILGRRAYPAAREFSELAFEIRELRQVGAYGLQPLWADGHAAGIYPFEYLRRLGLQPPTQSL